MLMYSPEEPQKSRNISREEFYENKNWHEIKKRYFCGESPKQIAKDYPDITERQITNRAFRYKWREAKAMINLAIEKGIEDTLMQIAERVEKITLKLLDDFLA